MWGKNVKVFLKWSEIQKFLNSEVLRIKKKKKNIKKNPWFSFISVVLKSCFCHKVKVCRVPSCLHNSACLMVTLQLKVRCSSLWWNQVILSLLRGSPPPPPPPQLVSVFLTIIFADEDGVDQYLIESANESQFSFSAPLPDYKKNQITAVTELFT